MLREQVQAVMLEVGPLADLMAVGAFEGRDVWTLVVDEETGVDADLDEDRGCLVLSAEVGQPAPADRASWLELLLRYNYQWADTAGARMAVAAEGGPVVLLADHPVAGLTAAELVRRLGTFVSLLRAWREILAQGAPSGAGGAAAPSAAGGFDPFAGMIRA